MVLKRVDGIEHAEVSYKTGQARVAYDPRRTSPDEFITKLEEMTGYRATIVAAE